MITRFTPFRLTVCLESWKGIIVCFHKRRRKLPLFHLISLGPFRAIRIGRWNEPPGRYFLSYECKNDFRDVLGQSVIDEFATFSGPILFGPAPILGNLYN